jgi:formylglycine-generating enzyme required for sulfatase activity
VAPWGDGFPGTAPVGSFEPNPYGLYDMAGNVAEWVRDGYGRYDVMPRPTDGLRREAGRARVHRGGSYEDDRPEAGRRGFCDAAKRQGLGVRPARRLDGEHAGES